MLKLYRSYSFKIYKILSRDPHNRVVRYAEVTIGDYQNDFRSGWEQMIIYFYSGKL